MYKHEHAFLVCKVSSPTRTGPFYVSHYEYATFLLSPPTVKLSSIPFSTAPTHFAAFTDQGAQNEGEIVGYNLFEDPYTCTELKSSYICSTLCLDPNDKRLNISIGLGF